MKVSELRALLAVVPSQAEVKIVGLDHDPEPLDAIVASPRKATFVHDGVDSGRVEIRFEYVSGQLDRRPWCDEEEDEDDDGVPPPSEPAARLDWINRRIAELGEGLDYD